MTTHPRPSHLSFWHKCVTGASRIAPETAAVFAPALQGVTDGSFVGQPPKSAATRDCSRVVEEVRSVFWDLCDIAGKQHGPSAMRGSSGKQPTRTKKRLRIPTNATRSVTPGSRSCKFATSAHRPKCRVRRDPSHHSGRQHRNERQVHMQRVMQAQAQNIN